ncbi:MAG: PSD1 and planctomycete cytochrome C domain-containing protein [Pirellulaceae bacterium]
MKSSLLLICVVSACCADHPLVIADEPAQPSATVTETLPIEPTPQQIEYFERKIRPLLHQHCFECHSADSKTLQGGLRLDSRHHLHRGGDSGPAVVAGKPEESLLIESIRHDDAAYPMPPKGKLAAHEIDELTRWVQQGAPFPASTDSQASMSTATIDIEASKDFWSFQPLKAFPLPKVRMDQWPRNRIDWFVLAALEQNDLQPTDAADRLTLLRRVSFDLTGLPPTRAQAEKFLSDSSPEAYDTLITQLMQSPAYGQRWARQWLDLARYTDTTASWLDSTGQAHLSRDWVVRALNEDMPYDQFVQRQLATDMMPTTGPDDLPALGFLGLSPTYWKELQLPCEIIKVIVADEWEERIDAVTRTFLGLTVACARCHDHKFDPISMEDYYALAGVMASTRLSEKPLMDEATYEPVRLAKAEVAKLNEEIKKLKKQKPVPQEEIDALVAKEKALIASTPHYDTPMANAVSEESLYVVRAGKTHQDGTRLEYKPGPQDLQLFIRGNPNRLGAVVPRRVIEVLSKDEPEVFEQGSGRLELARAITQDASALTARVIVNRIWLAHFGSGLVSTPSNFGQLGARPSHPELLDDLTARFVDNGWSLKWLHREIVSSATYQQASHRSEAMESKDPDNRWLGRMNRRRLDIESWRDAMLTVSGQMDHQMIGPSMDFDDAKNRFRTLYTTVHRRDMSKVLQLHDFPDPNAHSPQRIPTTTALQGLYLLNSPFVATQAETLARRIVNEFSGDIDDKIDQTHWVLFGRGASGSEIELARSFLGEQADEPESEAWRQYAHALLGCNEFLFVD